MECRETPSETVSAQGQESNVIELGPECAETQHALQRNVPKTPSRWVSNARRGALIALLLACLEMGGNILYHHSYYASYQPAQCLILDEQVTYVQPSGPNHSSPYYEPDVTYQILSPSTASPATYLGYAGPGSFQVQMGTSDEAQSLLDRYQVGHIYPCWYSSFGIQPESVLVLQPFAWWEIALTSFATLILGFLCSVIVLMLISFIVMTRRLRKQRVNMTGMIAESHVAFEISSDMVNNGGEPCANVPYELGSEMSVISGLQEPQHRFRTTGSLRGRELALWCFLVFFWIPLTIFLMALLWAA